MRFSYRLTGKRFEHLDFGEAVVALTTRLAKGTRINMPVWGAIFYPNHHPLDKGVLPAGFGDRKSAALFHNGWGEVIFDGVIAVQLKVWPYSPSLEDSGHTFMRDDAGELAELTKKWGVSGEKGIGQMYCLECIIEHPYGQAEVSIWCTGEVEIVADSNLLVPFSAFASSENSLSWRDRIVLL